MKQFLIALATSVLLLSGVPRAAHADVGIDFFYDNLSGGNWFEVDDYGYCWQPDVAVNDPTWRPYADGYWAYTDVGWTWVSYEDFGWATYHYGRWARLADYGWVWVPGSDLEWGPAWVSWRTGGEFIGWAPLPPRGPGIVYEGRPIGAQVDIEFDIGPQFYNFCDVRYIGEPVLRERIVPVQQNITCIDRTVNVTNITVTNNVVYNYGPDINVVNQHSSRPIQRLRLEREQNVDLTAAAKSGGITKVQGNSLVVAAPMKITKPAKPEAPPNVKAKVESAKMDTGWSGIGPNEQARVKEQIKTEDRTKVAPLGAGTEAAAQSGPSAGAATPPMGGKGNQKGRRGEETQQSATVAPANTPEPNPKRGKGFERGKPGATPGGSASPGENAGGPGKGNRLEEGASPAPMDETTQAPASSRPAKSQSEHEGKRRNIEVPANPGGQMGNVQGEDVNQPRGGKPRGLESPPSTGPQVPQSPPAGGAENPRGERPKVESANTPGGGSAGSPPSERKQGRGKEKGSPSPTPQ